jgi:DNA polymerase III delta prime subunit
MNNILNRENIKQEIQNMLKNYEENCKNINFKKGIYIYGPPGCGKTFFVNELLKELNYDIVKYDAGDVRNKSLIESIASNNISSQNVLTMMMKKTKKIAIVMDEIDGMNNGDKGGITALLKLIRQKKTKKQKLEYSSVNPIICIGNYFADKKIKELMKVCNTYELKNPTNSQIETIIYNQIPDFNISIEHILCFIQGDLRKVEFVKKIFYKNPDLLNEESLKNIFHTKRFNENSKKITQDIIDNPVSINNHLSVVNETDRTIVALLWHENIIDSLSSLDKRKSILFYNSILDNMCFADFIDRITFQKQIWQFNEMSSLIKTFYNNYLYHNTIKPIKITNTEVRFTKVLTKYSTEYNNSLFVYNLCQQLDMDKKDMISFFNELRLFYGEDFWMEPDIVVQIEQIFENYNIDKLEIKRMYRYLDKNAKKDLLNEDITTY